MSINSGWSLKASGISVNKLSVIGRPLRTNSSRFKSRFAESLNTLLGNINWAKATETDISSVWKENANDLKPIVNNVFSDSANLDLTLELLVRSGRPITDSLLTLIPEAFRDQPELINNPEITAFYEYAAGTQEPWDGPALIVFTDGKNIGATLDRNCLLYTSPSPRD